MHVVVVLPIQTSIASRTSHLGLVFFLGKSEELGYSSIVPCGRLKDVLAMSYIWLDRWAAVVMKLHARLTGHLHLSRTNDLARTVGYFGYQLKRDVDIRAGNVFLGVRLCQYVASLSCFFHT